MRLLALWERDLRVCHLCQEQVALDEASRDHVIPKSARGSNAESNLRLAHKACNSFRMSHAVDAFSVEEYRAARQAALARQPFKRPRAAKKRERLMWPESNYVIQDGGWLVAVVGPAPLARSIARWRCNWCGGNNVEGSNVCSHCFHTTWRAREWTA